MSFTEIKSTLEFIEAAIGSVTYSGQQNNLCYVRRLPGLGGAEG